MDQNTKKRHSTNAPDIVNFNLCNEGVDAGESSANVFNNSENYKNSSEDKIPLLKQQSAKKIKPNETNDAEIAAGISNDEQLPDIYKLPVELLADIFDYLSLKDLCLIRQTSKWFHQVAGLCFEKNYSALVKDFPKQKDIELDNFHDLLQGVIIHDDHAYYYIERHSEFKHVKKMKFYKVSPANITNEEMKETLNKIEHLMVNGVSMCKSLVERIPIFFPNLRTLSILSWQGGYNWIACRYPNLERFEITSAYELEIVEFGPFLKINPNIRKLAISSDHLWKNTEAMLGAKLDELALLASGSNWCLHMTTRLPPVSDMHTELFCKFLNRLYDRGSYKRLKLYATLSGCERIDPISQLSSINGLIKIQVHTIGYYCIWIKFPELKHVCINRFALSDFHSLEEISVSLSYSINDIEATANNLENLKRIQFGFADINDVMIFIKRSKTLTKIKVEHFIHTASYIERTKNNIIYHRNIHEYDFEKQKVINLPLLNAERAKLTNAKKVTIYVTEEVYLVTKWAIKATEFEFIQIKRFESYEWDTDFSMDFHSECNIRS